MFSLNEHVRSLNDNLSLYLHKGKNLQAATCLRFTEIMNEQRDNY